MLKRLPSRNQRSKGIRLKHVLQICLLLGVCFWLIYQVKHSHDKKKEFDENGGKTSVLRVSDGEILKLGRKDLPREDAPKIEKPEEEEEENPVEEEERHEEEQEEEDNKHEGKGEEEEENKSEEAEDAGGGDDEIDENDQEKKEEEANHDDDFVDDDKDQEGDVDDEGKTNDNEDIEEQIDNENSPEYEDSDGGDHSDHEAREEHYKADDASSEVAHDTQNVNTEIRTNLENTNENLETTNAMKSNNTEDANNNESKSGSQVGEGGVSENSTSLDVDSSGQKVLNSSVNGQLLETAETNDQPKPGNSTVQVSTEASNSSTVASSEFSNSTTTAVSTEESNNTTETRNERSSNSSQQNNKEEFVSDSGYTQNATSDGTIVGGSTGEKTSLLERTNNSNIDSENKVDSAKMENANGASKVSSDSSNSTEHDVLEKKPDEAAQTNDGSSSLTAKEDADSMQNENSENQSNAEGGEEGANSTSGTEDAIQHDLIDFSDSEIGQEVKEVRTDLDTLPDLRLQGDEIEGAAAE